MKNRNDFVQLMVGSWKSPFVSDGKVGEFSGFLLSGKTIKNRESLGQPVPRKIRVGGKVGRMAVELAEYIADQMQIGGSSHE
jgi:hypothetical protein